MTFQQADSGNVNPYYKKGFIGYERNCQTCVAVFLARLHGYDVQAIPNFNNKSITKLSYNTSLAYIDANGNHPGYDKPLPDENRIDFLERIVKKDEIRTLEFNKLGSGGHIVIVERNKTGELQFYDPQNNKITPKDEFQNYLYLAISLKSMNLTNCTIDEKFADKIMKKRS